MLICTVRKFNDVLVLDGGSDKDYCMTIAPIYFTQFDLKENDIVNTSVGQLYTYIDIIAKRVSLKNNRFGWEDKNGKINLIFDSDDSFSMEKLNLFRCMSNYHEMLTEIYLS